LIVIFIGIFSFNFSAQAGKTLNFEKMPVSSARYNPSTFESLKNRNINPENMGIKNQPANLSIRVDDPSTMVKFNTERVKRCHTAYWKQGFKPENLDIVKTFKRKRLMLILHNVTAQDNGECFFETFSTAPFERTPAKKPAK